MIITNCVFGVLFAFFVLTPFQNEISTCIDTTAPMLPKKQPQAVERSFEIAVYTCRPYSDVAECPGKENSWDAAGDTLLEQGLLSWSRFVCAELSHTKVSLQNLPFSSSTDISRRIP